jgi:hypothetical protein
MIEIRLLQRGNCFADLISLSREFFREYDFFATQGLQYYTVFTAVENRAALEFYVRNGLAPLYTTMIGKAR